MTPSVVAAGAGIRFLFDRQQRLVTPGVARLRRHGTELWGIRGIELELGPGDSLALVGASGAGKTTLLRAIAGILVADEGRLEVSGRVGSLLSVDAGLTPTLTGRENCVMLAALLGLPRRGFARVLEGIKERSGLRDAFERPVSSFSHGMAARLGFAVVEASAPDILLLDEVHEALDHEFRRVLEEFALDLVAGGGIVVAAGHDHELLERLCRGAVRLERGRLAAQGTFAAIAGA